MTLLLKFWCVNIVGLVRFLLSPLKLSPFRVASAPKVGIKKEGQVLTAAHKREKVAGFHSALNEDNILLAQAE